MRKDEQLQPDEFYKFSNVEEWLAFIMMNPVRCVWNMLYRREMIKENHILFPVGYIYGDIYLYELVKHYTKRVYKEPYIEMPMFETIGLIKTYIIRYGKIESTALVEVKEKIRLYKKRVCGKYFITVNMGSRGGQWEQKNCANDTLMINRGRICRSIR